MNIDDDEGVQIIFDNLNNISTYRTVELYVEYTRVSEPVISGHMGGTGPTYEEATGVSYHGTRGPSYSVDIGSSYPREVASSYREEAGPSYPHSTGSSYDAEVQSSSQAPVTHSMLDGGLDWDSQYTTRIATQTKDEDVDPVIEFGVDDDIESDSNDDEEEFNYKQYGPHEEVAEQEDNVGHDSGRVGDDSRTMPGICAVTKGMIDLNIAPPDVSGFHNIPPIAPLSSFVFPALPIQ
ncbi:hypothetical protein M5689_004150 [Euphorbia peplus]|nr:hypothetical protein M5689_004150 [Euphorbia peplus]